MTAAHGYTQQKDNYAKRLRRVEGQVRGIARMIEEDKYCIDVLTQISAVTSALRSVALNLLDEHLSHCVTRAVAEGGPGLTASWQRPRQQSRAWFVPDRRVLKRKPAHHPLVRCVR